jgi:D-3-phosphoglycerate dehydrogenase / 2-oxoglutarate reductase
MEILLLESIHKKSHDWLFAKDDLTLFSKSQGDTVNYEAIQAILTRGIEKINPELIDLCPNLKVVARCGVGLDNVDVKYCSLKNIPVVYAPGSNAQTTAEHTMMLMLNLVRNSYQAFTNVKGGNWAIRNQFTSDELYGKKLGILGLGNIGLKVAKMGEAFGMDVRYWSRSEKLTNNGLRYVELEEFIKESDVISVHIALNPDTKALINKNFISKCKNGVYFINTARADIFDRNDLLDGLNTGKIAGYAADVPMSPYPTLNDEIISHPNTLITPHVSSLTDYTYYQMCQGTVENVYKLLKGNKILPQNIANSLDINLSIIY